MEASIAQHRVVELDLAGLAASALAGSREVPKDRLLESISRDVPSTYVPARNTILLALALAWAASLQARDLYLGVNAVDYSGYPDCRPEFLEAFDHLAAVGTAAGTERGARFRVHAPLLRLSKREIVLRAEQLGVDLSLTHTCYDPVAESEAWIACGRCDACRLRLEGFRQAGRADPLRYAIR